MRKYLIVLLSGVFSLQACASVGEVLFPPTNTPAPTFTATVTVPPTSTATLTNTPQPTATVTIVRFFTQDPNLPSSTFAPVSIILEGGITATPLPINLIPTLLPINLTPTVYRPGVGFLSVSISLNKIFWGSCKHNKTTITAIVEDEDEAFSVVIFTRVKSAIKDDSTPWTNGNVMHDHRDGTYTYVLRGSEVEGHNHYKNSWVIFQLVAVDIDGNEVGRTQIYEKSIALSPCM